MAESNWRWRLLLLAVGLWLTGFWWCGGRWEQGLLLRWLVLPAFACNADRVWSLWKAWYRERPLALLAMFSLVELQFWLSGVRGGRWWDGAGAGLDFALLAVVVSALVILSEKAFARRVLWQGAFAVGALATAFSLVEFYSNYGLSEQRFRLVWRYQPGFNAVTTGILVGFALVAGLCDQVSQKRGVEPLRWLGLLVLGFALAASESRGALLASIVGCGALLWSLHSRKASLTRLAFPLAGFVIYWLGVRILSEESGALIDRGSAGRLEIYQYYLAQLSGWDWIFGKGEVPVLRPPIFGWKVHHTHCAYLGQLVAYGLPSLLLLLALLGRGLWELRKKQEFALLAFGLIAILFDGGLVFSLFSLARWEFLVVVIPLVVGVSYQGSFKRKKAHV